jgi:hypothetical protein
VDNGARPGVVSMGDAYHGIVPACILGAEGEGSRAKRET